MEFSVGAKNAPTIHGLIAGKQAPTNDEVKAFCICRVISMRQHIFFSDNRNTIRHRVLPALLFSALMAWQHDAKSDNRMSFLECPSNPLLSSEHHRHQLARLVLRNRLRRGPLPSDPFQGYQWHLDNIGQSVFADARPLPDVDLNMGALHSQGIIGQGVKIAILDGGIDTRHEDLSPNFLPGKSKNFLDGSNDPISILDRNHHGTAVAGVIGAVAGNGKGGRGVSPGAKLLGFNVVDAMKKDGSTSIRKYVGYAWGEGEEASDADIFNNSYDTSHRSNMYPPVEKAEIAGWENLMRSTRRGKGGIYIIAGGDHFLESRRQTGMESSTLGCPANAIGLGCRSPNIRPKNNFIHAIAVAAVNAQGVRSSQASTGSSLWVSAPGGEAGYQQALSRIDPHPDDYGPGILTTDISGCARGYNTSTEHRNAFEGGSLSNPNCNYTAAFHGTSAAAAMVSGVVALMLSVNPQLSQRDVKHILAKTARPVDLQRPAIFYQGKLVESGWITNAAGYRYSNWYGFGLVDASAAVAEARNFRPLPPMLDSGWLVSPEKSAHIGTGQHLTTRSVLVSQNMTVEAVQFSLKTTHRQPRSLMATLSSPSGTVSHVLTPLSNLKGGHDFVIPLSSSNAFYGEPARGKWTLQISDMGRGHPEATIESFELRIVGHANG